METVVSNRRIGATHSGLTGLNEELDKFIEHLMTGQVCVIPNVFDIAGVFPGLSEYYKGIWESTYGDKKVKNPIEEDVKFLQGMAMDGDFWGYNLQSGEVNLYTGDFSRVEELTGRKINPELTVKKNQDGIIHCVRLDIDYESENNFKLKPTTLRSDTNVTAQGFVLIPYAVTRSMFRVLRNLLKSNQALYVTQSGSVSKGRFVSIKKSVVKAYTDKFLTDVPKVQSFPMKGWIYLPTLGAPSTSLGLTRLDLFRIERIEKVSNASNLPIAKVDPDPVSSLVMSEVLQTYLEKLFKPEFNENGVEIKNTKTEGLRNTVLDVLGMPKEENVSTLSLFHRVHELSTEQLLGLWGILPQEWHHCLLRVKKEINGVRYLDNFSNLKDLLSREILMVTYVTSGAKFKRIIVTNNEEKLERLYGKGYVKRYESDRVRARTAMRILELSGDLGEVYEETGIYLEPEQVDSFVEAYEEAMRLKEESPRKVNDNLVTARALFQLSGSKYYYQNIPLNRIYKVAILGS